MYLFCASKSHLEREWKHCGKKVYKLIQDYCNELLDADVLTDHGDVIPISLINWRSSPASHSLCLVPLALLT